MIIFKHICTFADNNKFSHIFNLIYCWKMRRNFAITRI